MRLISGSTANECSSPCTRAPRERSGDCRLEGAHRAPCADGGACPAPAPTPQTHTLPAQCPWGRTLTCSRGVSSCRHWSRASVTTHRAAPQGRAPWAVLTAEG